MERTGFGGGSTVLQDPHKENYGPTGSGMLLSTSASLSLSGESLLPRSRDESTVKLRLGSSREKLDAAEQALLHSVRDNETDSQSLRSAFLAVFRSLDVNKTGFLSLDELKRGLRSVGHDLSDLEAQTLMKRFDTSGKNRISYEDFVARLLDTSKRSGVSRGKPVSSSLSPRGIAAETATLASALIQRIRRHVGVRSQSSLSSILSDTRGATIAIGVTRRQFNDVMAKLGYRLLDSEVDLLFARFDPTRSNLIPDDVVLHDILGVDVSFVPKDDSLPLSALLSQTDTINPKRPTPAEAPSVPVLTATSAMRDYLQRLRDAMKASGRAAAQTVFQAMDTNSGGRLSKFELGQGLERLGLLLAPSELTELFRLHDKNGDGVVSLGEFLDAYCGPTPLPALKTTGSLPVTPEPEPVPLPVPQSQVTLTSRPTPPEMPSKLAAAFDDVIKLIAKVARHLGGRTRDAVESVFATLDSNKSGKLSRHELAGGMSRLGYDLLPSEVDQLFTYLDKNGDGVVALKEFLDAVMIGVPSGSASALTASPAQALPSASPLEGQTLSKPLPSSTIANAAKAWKELAARIKRSVGPLGRDTMKSIFSGMDTNGDGTLSRDELSRAMIKLGYGLLSTELDVVFAVLDRDGNGKLNFAEFAEAVGDPDAVSHRQENSKALESTVIPVQSNTLLPIPSHVLEDLLALSPSFFDEVEELKYKYVEAVKMNGMLQARLFDVSRGREGQPRFSPLDDIDITHGFGHSQDPVRVLESSLESGVRAATSDTVLSGIAAGRRVLSWRNTGMPVPALGDTPTPATNTSQDPDVALWRKLRETWDLTAECSKPVVSDGLGRSWKFDKPSWLATVAEEPTGFHSSLLPTADVPVVQPAPAPAPAPLTDTAFSVPAQPDAEAALALLVGKLQRAIGCKASDAILTVFRAVDANGNKLLSREELGDALTRLGFGIMNSELDLLFRKFDRNGDGVIGFPEFLDTVLSIKEQVPPPVAVLTQMPPKAPPAASLEEGQTPRSTALEASEVAVIVERLRNALESKPYGTILDAFTLHSIEGRVTKFGFSAGVQQVGYKLLSFERDAVFEKMAGKEASVPVRDAVQFVRPMSRAHSAIDSAADELARVLQSTRDRLKTSTSQAVETVFRSIDSNGSGKLSRSELDGALQKLGVSLQRDEMDQLFRHFDKDEDGVVSLREFLRAMDVIVMASARVLTTPPASFQASAHASPSAPTTSGGPKAQWWKQVDKPKLDLGASLTNENGPVSLTSLLSDQPDSAVKRFHEVESFLQAEENAKANSADLSRSSRSVSFDDKTQRVENAVRAKLLKLRVGSGLKRQFERFASSGGGNLTLPQLKQALLHLGLDLNPTELKALFSRLDSNASGKISYAELEEFLSGPQHRTSSALKLYGRSSSQGRSKSPLPSRSTVSAWDARDHRKSGSPGRFSNGGFKRASLSPRPHSVSPVERTGDFSTSVHSLSEYLKQEHEEAAAKFVSPSDLKIREAVRKALRGKSASRSLDTAPLLAAFQRYDPQFKRRIGSFTSSRVSSAERRHDEAPSGTVSSVEFERALLSLGVDMTEDQLAELITDLEIETHGRVHYQGFVKFVQGEDFRASQELAMLAKVDKLEQQLLAEVLARSRIGPASSQDYNLSRGFAFLDRRRSKHLTLDDVHSICGDLGFCKPIPLSLSASLQGADSLPTESRQLVALLFQRMLGEGNATTVNSSLSSRTLEYHQFVRWAAPLDPRLQHMRDLIQIKFKKLSTIGGGGVDFSRAFRRFDKDDSGQITVAEFRDALGSLVSGLTHEELKLLAAHFDMDADGKISYPEFVKMMEA